MARQRQETGKGSSRRRISQRLLLMILGRDQNFTVNDLGRQPLKLYSDMKVERINVSFCGHGIGHVSAAPQDEISSCSSKTSGCCIGRYGELSSSTVAIVSTSSELFTGHGIRGTLRHRTRAYAFLASEVRSWAVACRSTLQGSKPTASMLILLASLG